MDCISTFIRKTLLLFSGRRWYSFTPHIECELCTQDNKLGLETIQSVNNSKYLTILNCLNNEDFYLSQLHSIYIYKYPCLAVEEIVLNEKNKYDLNIYTYDIFLENLFF